MERAMRFIQRAVLATGVFAAGLWAAGCQRAQAPGSADSRPVAEILASDGLARADLALAARTQDAETAFELGAVRFLRAVEAVLQVRYESYNATNPFVPGMRADLPPNLQAHFDPAFLETAMTRALEHLSGAAKALGPATAGQFAVSLPLDAVWLDVDGDGARDEWESLAALLDAMGAQADWDDFDGTIRFDTADAEWLAAYVEMMSGAAELVLSVDPTSAIRTVYDGREALKAKGVDIGLGDAFIGRDFIDQAATVLLAMEGKPDAARTKRALVHFQNMIAHNRKFWPEMMTETDSDHEWLPNPRQSSAFGIEITDEVAQGWQDVLGEIEEILDGRALVPYSLAGMFGGPPPEVGINIRKFLTDPPDLNAVLLIQGASIAPYLEHGKLANMEAWQRFELLTRGDGLLLAVLLN